MEVPKYYGSLPFPWGVSNLVTNGNSISFKLSVMLENPESGKP